MVLMVQVDLHDIQGAEVYLLTYVGLTPQEMLLDLPRVDLRALLDRTLPAIFVEATTVH